ncbi:Nitroreductase [Desulfotomaculum arcticum]|uniref:Nitroreductase n=1 Tax=Desulfotruncus arcticus DSM 17038 TaxID=1121424 RepID=A0A1I2SCA8_9FIRM|nr:nitroreductase family protein [Desulfotruncus arcticus]SFG50438.1 Nitroreductase [Desulfotomaculum arcticum] [Desulfotruncus arcticus DSM 17038]
MINELVVKNRSYRRFYQNQPITPDTLEKLVNLARLSASGGNKQPLKYILSCNPEKNALIYDCLAWAAYLKDWNGPPEGERPSAYLIILNDTSIPSPTLGIDVGIACQSILLGAVETGLGGCILASVNKNKLTAAIEIPQRYEIMVVIALGVPKEKVVLKEVVGDDIKYWRDSEGVHYVPKRTLNEIIL